MRELNSVEQAQVSGGLMMAEGGGGGRFLVDWALSEALSWAVGQAAAGNVDYAGLVDQNGSNYCVLGA